MTNKERVLEKVTFDPRLSITDIAIDLTMTSSRVHQILREAGYVHVGLWLTAEQAKNLQIPPRLP